MSKELKKIDLDFLYSKKKEKKEKSIRIFLAIALIIFVFIVGYDYFKLSVEKSNLLNKKAEIEKKLIEEKEAFKRNGKLLKNYEKKYKKLVDEINQTIDLKAFPIASYIEYLRANTMGVLISNFTFTPDRKIRIQVRANTYSSLINFKDYLEKKFLFEIKEDKKSGGFYTQTILLKEKNGGK